MKYVACMVCAMFFYSLDAMAEGGCPPGQLPAQSNGSMASCVPIPQDNPQPQQPRPTGKWIKTWGAIADDGADHVGVSSGNFSKTDAAKEAIMNCERGNEKKCRVVHTYENNCVAVADPIRTGHAISSIESGPSLDEISNKALASCKKDNPGSECKIGYSNCTEPVFQKF
ncbi:DUF4189 domain-containing protein [Xanthomonas albilineans]|uniref:DUF4189 domain-containing protein n=1 Tax=Xanthomonas albilineans TaxID=29447 RepID=UPI00126A1AD4|nr:DUF4189 domain-containing protein [Xanthomonas albilineans]